MKKGKSKWILLALVFCIGFSILGFVQNTSAANRSDVEAFVSRFYKECMRRSPDAAGLEGWVNDLLNGSSTGSDVAYGFVFSKEFIGFDTAPSDYLNVLYKAFFDRNPDSAGFNTWLAVLLADDSLDSREHVLKGFIYAQEFAELCQRYGIKAFGDAPTEPRDFVEAFVTRFYQLCLGRSPDPAGLQGWTDELINQTKAGADVARGFIYSNEFIGFNTTNDQYLMVLYKAFFDRDPDQAGWNTWLASLNSGRDRGEVLDGFIYSQEFADLCNQYGIIPVRDGIPPVTPVCQDVSGTWSVTEINDERNCGYGPAETYTNNYRVTQNGCAISVTDDWGGSYSGTVNGNQISWSGSYPEPPGTTTINNLSLTISGNSLSGSASWTYNEPGYQCSGTTQISGNRF